MQNHHVVANDNPPPPIAPPSTVPKQLPKVGIKIQLCRYVFYLQITNSKNIKVTQSNVGLIFFVDILFNIHLVCTI